MDDGSTDDTKEIVQKYLLDSRIRYLYKENGGVGSARNMGIRLATGNSVMFLDSDDELVSESLALISSAILKYSTSSIFSFRAIDQNGQQVSYTGKVTKDQIISFEDFVSKKYIKGEAFLVFRKHVFYGNAFDEDINGGEGLLLLRLIKESGLMIVNTNVRIYHTESIDSLISSKLTKDKMLNIRRIQLRLIERYGRDLKEYNKKYLGTTYLVAARAMVLTGMRMESMRCFVQGCRYNILDVKGILLYVLSFIDYNLRINNSLNLLHNRYRHE